MPPGTRVIFLAPPGATISDRLGQIADTKGDLSRVPTLTMEGGAEPDLRIYPGAGLNIQGTPIQVTDSKGKLLSEVIRENHLEGKDVVVSTCFQSDEGPWRGIVIKRPEDYR